MAEAASGAARQPCVHRVTEPTDGGAWCRDCGAFLPDPATWWRPVERGPWRRPDHDALRAVLRVLPEDYTPYGEDERWADPARAYPDCSCGCRFAAWLADGGRPSADWLVCTNPASHRAGLLTFEHQGCERFEPEDDGDEA